MNIPLFPIVILVLMLSNTVYAITPQSIYGGSGLGLIRTAEVLPEGESSTSFSGLVEEYNNLLTPGTSDLHIEAMFAYATSFGGHTEVGFVAPYSLYSVSTSGLSYSGSRGLKGFLKHSFTEPVLNEGTGVSFTIFGDIYSLVPSTDLIGGDPVYGTEINISHWTQTSGFHLNIGYANNYVWQEALVPVFVTDNTVSLSAAVEVGVSDALTFSLQGLTSQAMTTGDENIVLSSLFSYAMSNTLNMQLGIAAGLSDRSHPNQNFFFAMNYSPTSKTRSRYAVTGTSEQLYQQNSDILSKLDSIDKRLAQMESRFDEPMSHKANSNTMHMATAAEKSDKTAVVSVVPPASEADDSILRIEIINTTRDKKALSRIRKKLTDSGYRIVSTKTVLDNKLDRSVVHYFSGLSDDAKKIGHIFPGNQIIVKRELPEGVDFRFYIGRDLAK